jgi:uncharacterized protein
MRVGTVESLWRYPVKSMRGERLTQAYLGFAGVYGDRIYSFMSSANPVGFPYLTGRTQHALLQYQPRFRNVALAAQPPGLEDAEARAPGSGLTPVYPDPAELGLEVLTPGGTALAIDDPELLAQLHAGLPPGNELSLIKSQRALTDCRPLSLFSMQTVRQLERELGLAVDPRRFRANLYIDLAAADGFGEDAWVGHSLRIGSSVIRILKRDTRCKMITLDPDTGESNPAFFKQVQRAHEQQAGVYGAVLVEGLVQVGDELELLG